MRRNSNSWSVTCAAKPGHYHLYKGANCQDAAAVAAMPARSAVLQLTEDSASARKGLGQIVVGIGCDGCGEGRYSEMGALALTNFALGECLQHHLRSRSPSETLQHLFPAIVRFIDTNVTWSCPHYGDPAMDAARVADFIKNYWLATMMGFIITDEESVLFWCGDGTYAIDDEAYQYIDQDNTPRYIAYNCLYMPETVGVTAENIPRQFDSMVITPESRVMVASDGFGTKNPDKLAVAREREELPDSLEGLQWGKKGQFGLKKWMNSRSDRGHFEDDCFIITAERL